MHPRCLVMRVHVRVKDLGFVEGLEFGVGRAETKQIRKKENRKKASESG